MMHSRRTDYFFGGLVVGLMFGVVLGILMAPTSGFSTRRRLVRSARSVADAARAVADRAEQAAELLGERVDRYLGRDEEVAWRKVREIREGVERYGRAQL